MSDIIKNAILNSGIVKGIKPKMDNKPLYQTNYQSKLIQEARFNNILVEVGVDLELYLFILQIRILQNYYQTLDDDVYSHFMSRCRNTVIDKFYNLERIERNYKGSNKMTTDDIMSRLSHFYHFLGTKAIPELDTLNKIATAYNKDTKRFKSVSDKYIQKEIYYNMNSRTVVDSTYALGWTILMKLQSLKKHDFKVFEDDIINVIHFLEDYRSDDLRDYLKSFKGYIWTADYTQKISLTNVISAYNKNKQAISRITKLINNE